MFLKKDLGMKETTKVVSYALDFLFSETKNKKKQKTPFELMDEYDLIGSIDSPSNLSEDYKDIILKSLNKKHNIRVKNEK